MFKLLIEMIIASEDGKTPKVEEVTPNGVTQASTFSSTGISYSSASSAIIDRNVRT